MKLPSLFAVALSVTLGACVSVEETATFDDIEEDSDGAEDDEFRYVPIFDSCGDHEQECIQGCHDDFHDICMPTARAILYGGCRSAAEQTSGAPDCFDPEGVPFNVDLCLDLYWSCLDGQWRPDIKNAHDTWASNCEVGRLVCLSAC
ncbi:MAG: hypothetical protein AAF799_20625 [Myxococcota bacterium]